MSRYLGGRWGRWVGWGGALGGLQPWADRAGSGGENPPPGIETRATTAGPAR
jgi:hypothetical protein